MIVARLPDPLLRRALVAAAHPEEDVVWEPALTDEALRLGFPRLLVRSDGWVGGPSPEGLAVLDLDDALLATWEADWWSAEVPGAWARFVTERLRGLVDRAFDRPTWVDAALADLGRAAGARLPLALRCFARRVLEFPARYTSLDPIAAECRLSKGALKAKFRRRSLGSPSAYLRWFRLMAVAEVLSDRSVSVSAAAHRLGFTSPGNMCRTMSALTSITPTEARTVLGWNRLLLLFASTHLTPSALEAWSDLDTLFERRAA